MLSDYGGLNQCGVYPPRAVSRGKYHLLQAFHDDWQNAPGLSMVTPHEKLLGSGLREHFGFGERLSDAGN